MNILHEPIRNNDMKTETHFSPLAKLKKKLFEQNINNLVVQAELTQRTPINNTATFDRSMWKE